MQAKDVMTARLELVNRRATLRDASRKMEELNVGVLPVVDKGGHLVGVVTDRDIVVRGIARGLLPEMGHVEDVMTPQVVTCYAGEELQRVASLMDRHGVRRIVVLNDRGKPVGLVSIDDLAARGGEGALLVEALRHGPAESVAASGACPTTANGRV